MNKSSILVPLVALVLGGGIGAASAEPEVVTKEVEVVKEVEKEVKVEVPGPVEYRTPDSCLAAIQGSREIAGSVARFVDAASRYPALVPQAAQAGMDVDPDALNAVTAEVQSITEDMAAENDTVGPLIAAFDAAATDCQNNE